MSCIRHRACSYLGCRSELLICSVPLRPVELSKQSDALKMPVSFVNHHCGSVSPDLRGLVHHNIYSDRRDDPTIQLRSNR